jgi:hypothetical protein
MAFKSTTKTHRSVDSPESLFADIKSKQIPGLLTQQGDVLREYMARFVDATDVAAQMPTGSGKTLVALLIAEWRRLSKNERVVYLCPTNQLVHQVTDQARSTYGIDVVPFTGKIVKYSPADKLRYSSSQAIAVTSYSSLFNSNPYFQDPHFIVLDDAHAAEQPVASNWTIELKKWEPKDVGLFNAVVSALRPVLDDVIFRRLAGEAGSRSDLAWVDKLPSTTLADIAPELEAVIDANIIGSSASYAWESLQGHLYSCNLFMTSGAITIRPYLAPTFSHEPFEQATQRLYLSATPGEGGELERVFCRERIDRLTPPAGSQKHTIGRRFFVFPELALSAAEQNKLILKLAERERLLVLAGDTDTADEWKAALKKNTRAKVFSASDIEKSKQEFVQSDPGVAVLANRYDGIDFPGKECRKTVLVDIPTAANPQEKFFITRLAASRVYDARMLTRIIQSFGRCTRSATDYSLVVVFGDRLVSYLSKRDRQTYFHPELQGELQFGLAESSATTLEGTVENVDAFLAQSGEWKQAESQIYAYRDSATQSKLPGSDELAAVVQNEVRYVRALWNGDFVEALECCRNVLGGLGDPTLRGSRAMWNYFAGNTATQLAKRGMSGMAAKAAAYYRAAASAAPSLSWLYGIGDAAEVARDGGVTVAESLQLDGIEKTLLALGVMHSRKYDKAEAEIRSGIHTEDQFERSHRLLGELLGFSAGKVESSGSPDPWWRLANSRIWVFEDHAGAKETSKLSVTKARQAATHENWIRAKLPGATKVPVTKVLITPVTHAELGAKIHLHDVKLWSLGDFRSWVEGALSALRELRRTLGEAGDLEWRASAIGLLRERRLAAELLTRDLPTGEEILQE